MTKNEIGPLSDQDVYIRSKSNTSTALSAEQEHKHVGLPNGGLDTSLYLKIGIKYVQYLFLRTQSVDHASTLLQLGKAIENILGSGNSLPPSLTDFYANSPPFRHHTSALFGILIEESLRSIPEQSERDAFAKEIEGRIRDISDEARSQSQENISDVDTAAQQQQKSLHVALTNALQNALVTNKLTDKQCVELLGQLV